MNFTSLPSNGASWREPLVYKIDTESTTPQDVILEIVDTANMSILGTMRLYGVTTAEVDIAPYIASTTSLVPGWTNGALILQRSQSARSVLVRADGVESASRIFYRSAFNYTQSTTLSSVVEHQEIEQGDVARITVFGKTRLWVTYNSSAAAEPKETTATTRGYPIELMMSTLNMRVGTKFSVSIRYETGYSDTFNYTVVSRRTTSTRLLWYNTKGGIDSAIFDHTIRLGCGVDVATESWSGTRSYRSVEGWANYRLCTGYESAATIDMMLGVLFSPKVFSDRESKCEEVDVTTREVVFDSKGQLHTLSLDIRKEWKGGEL